MTFRNVVRAPFLTLLLVALFVTTAHAKRIDKQFQHRFPASPGTVLHLVHGDANVTIAAWAKDSIAVKIQYRGDVNKIGWGKEPDFDVEFSQTGPTVHAIGTLTGAGTAGFLTVKNQDYRVDVQAPTYVALDFDGEDGEVTVAGWKGDVALRLEDGDASLRDITAEEVRVAFQDGRVTLEGIRADVFLEGEDGNLRLENVDVPKGNIRMQDGDVTLLNVRGNFDIEMEDGDLHLTRGRLENASIHTENGDVDLDLDLSPELDLDVFTRAGSVRVGLEPQSSVRFAVETKEGRLRVDLPGATGVRDSKDRVTGDWNGGAGRLRVITIEGPVDVRQRSR